ncbi:flagellar filament capping protein FliD, partial [Escherichia coli]|nr:flagellar filament capping protein FliD [Escherichia coli]
TSVSSPNTAFTATTSTEASTGSFTVNVNQMAKAQVLTSGSIGSNTELLGESTGAIRTITITQPGTEKPLEVELSDTDTTLSGIASAINKANGNVSASVVKAKDGDYRLMLTSKATGTEGQMTIKVTGDDTLQEAIGYN